MFTHPSTTDSVQVPNHRLTKKRDVVADKKSRFQRCEKTIRRVTFVFVSEARFDYSFLITSYNAFFEAS